MCTDVPLSVIDIIRLRFKIEHSFKQAMRLIGSFAYYFWMQDMTHLRYRNDNQYLHRTSEKYRNHVMSSFGLGLSPRGCSSISPSLLPSSFGIRLGPGSEPFVQTSRRRVRRCQRVASDASRFSSGSSKNASLAKFITDRQDTGNMRIFRLAA
jgi:hypothetical protein